MLVINRQLIMCKNAYCMIIVSFYGMHVMESVMYLFRQAQMCIINNCLYCSYPLEW